MQRSVIQVHQCIKCGEKFRSSEELTDGCPKCGSRYFRYVADRRDPEPVGDPIETIMVRKNGIYEVNLTSLLEDDSIIVSDEEGKYFIDLNFLLKKNLKRRVK
nr:Zn-ribbon domain-containing protein [Methanothermobacter sp. K4]